ncbi:MAG: hypothetical protein JWP16_1043 [Alphaproteobacteria bacterium]|nr:hypothetical protein [Alphaproteobacteria bacterium]MDB5740003.1 hypothetical protein [Alphaproteobacteria bacterium]
MPKKKLLDDMLQNPTRFYRLPADVLRDRRFADGERLEILRAWRDQDNGGDEIDALIVELEHRLTAHDHAAE